MPARPARPARLLCCLLLAAAGCGAAAATQSGAQEAEEEDPNPCTGPHAGRLRCPDLRMGTPADLYLERHGPHLWLRSENNLKSRGEGPIMLRGTRSGPRTMFARQHIYRVNGSRKIARTGARLYFQFVAGQGRYWKWKDAARFELWSLKPDGTRDRLVRTGPKLNYCLRDLKRTAPSPRSPRSRVFPGCSQNPAKRKVTLGTSVGWSDVYPAQYYQQWVDVTGLRGCFAYVHRADPKNVVWETNEGNNDAQRVVRLPWRGNTRECR